jgi:hypothetical protein
MGDAGEAKEVSDDELDEEEDDEEECRGVVVALVSWYLFGRFRGRECSSSSLTIGISASESSDASPPPPPHNSVSRRAVSPSFSCSDFMLAAARYPLVSEQK